MVEETVYSNKPKPKPTRPRPVFLWGVSDVQKWLRRHCGLDCYNLYGNLFTQHDITGRSLIRLHENSLKRLGIIDSDHRQEIWREILKLRLKTAILEIKDLENRDI